MIEVMQIKQKKKFKLKCTVQDIRFIHAMDNAMYPFVREILKQYYPPLPTRLLILITTEEH
jgi:hypothetical protein